MNSKPVHVTSMTHWLVQAVAALPVHVSPFVDAHASLLVDVHVDFSETIFFNGVEDTGLQVNLLFIFRSFCVGLG